MNRNPLLDTIDYDVHYLYGFVLDITANQTAKNMLLQVYSKCNHLLFLKDITDHCKDSYSINNNNGFLNSKSGNLHTNNTTRGWTLEVNWKDVSV